MKAAANLADPLAAFMSRPLMTRLTQSGRLLIGATSARRAPRGLFRITQGRVASYREESCTSPRAKGRFADRCKFACT